MCVFFLGDPLLLLLFFLVLFLFSGVACFDSLKKNRSGFFLGLWVDELVCMLLLPIDALAISFPFLNQCYSLIFCEIAAWLHHDLQSYEFASICIMGLCVSLCMCV